MIINSFNEKIEAKYLPIIDEKKGCLIKTHTKNSNAFMWSV